MEYAWMISDPACPEKVKQLAKEVRINPLLASLLVQRGVTTFSEAERFFRPSLAHVNDPFLFRQMTQAVELLGQCIKDKKRIRLFGDYDVDGTTAVAMVMNALHDKSEHLDFYIPDRYTEGYGLSQQGVDAAITDNIDLLITLDCGIRSVELINILRQHNIQVIVCDHHEPGEQLPDALILDPKVPGETYPFNGLSGAGVGMKLLEALFKLNNWSFDALYEQLDLLALSIAADIVPVTNENRVYAFHGLKRINSYPRSAFTTMLKAANRTGIIKLNDLVFGLAPRINAAGRIRSGRTAVACMLEPLSQDIDALIQAIEADNQTRRGLDEQMTKDALSRLEQAPENRSVNVLADPNWHKGVVGIVASRVIEKYPLPTIILTEHNGMLSGSARTVGNFDIHQALIACSDLLIQFGGHQHAAGLSLYPDNLALFIERMDSLAASYFLTHSRVPELEFDAPLELNEIFLNEPHSSIPKLVRILEGFEPHGPGNHKPVFKTSSVYALSSTVLKSLHLKLSLTQPDSRIALNAIGFGMHEKLDDTANWLSFDILHSLEVNHFNNKSTVQLVLKDLKPTAD